MSPHTPLPPATTDALTRRNRIPFQLSLLALRLMDEPGRQAMTEVIRQGSRAVNRAHYEARCVDRTRLGLAPRSNDPAPTDREDPPVSGVGVRLPKTTDATTGRNRLPLRLNHMALKLMDQHGQRAVSAVLTAGARAVNDAWRAERSRQGEEMLASGRLSLRARTTTPTPTKETR